MRLTAAGSRLDTFVDAAFAFSLTLLVISYNELPDSVAELREALRRLPVFLLCFALVGMFWNAHRLWRGRGGADHPRPVLLSLGLVMVVLVYVYPLRMVVSSFLAFVTGGWVPSELGLSADSPNADMQTAFLVYSAGFGLMAALVWRLNAWSVAHADALGLDADQRHDVAAEAGAYALLTGFAVASALASLVLLAVDPPLDGRSALVASLPMWIYGGLGIAMPLYASRNERRRTRLHAGLP